MTAYTGIFARWGKAAGAKPDDALLDATAVAFRRLGTWSHLAAAMYARPEGATQPEVIMGTGDTHYDALRALKAAGFTVTKGGARGGHAVYTATLAKPTKAKGGNKPRKAKAKPEAVKPEVTNPPAPEVTG